MSTRTVTNSALDRDSGMTLGELATFVSDAFGSGLAPDSEVRVHTGWGGFRPGLQVREVWATGEAQQTPVQPAPAPSSSPDVLCEVCQRAPRRDPYGAACSPGCAVAMGG